MANNMSMNFPPFDPDVNQTTVGNRFTKYVERFKNYTIAMNIKDKARKRALFLYTAGFKVQDIFETLEDTGDDFDTAATKLAEYFQPKKNNLYNIYQFRQIQQEQDENSDDYCTRLKQAAKLCEFPEGWQDTEIQLQILDKGRSKRIRRQLLSKEHTLQEALQFARAQEIADSQATTIEKGLKHLKTPVEEINETSSRTKRAEFSKTKNCFFCGGKFPHQGGRTKCPAWGKECKACNKLNHFAKCCKGPNSRKEIRRIEKEDSDQSDSDSSDNISVYNVGTVSAIKTDGERRPIRTVKIDNNDMDVLIDTGATANIMDEEAYRKLYPRGQKLRKAKSIMQPYHTDENPTPPLCIIGKFDAVIESNTRMVIATFHVVKGKTKTEPLLSYKTAQELNMVIIAQTVAKEPSRVEELLIEYSDTFEGIGKMDGIKIDLNIDSEVRPVSQPLRRIPFSVRPKIEEELRRLEKEDIIEKIDKPTSWVSPTVITPKKNPNEIRLNVDMRVANSAIPRVNSITPTIEEMIHELNGAEVFSHLDMNHGYHQLELEENSRDITTFSTHTGFYRYKRLNYGTKSAADIFQNKVREELTQHIPGVINISDDILVSGKNQQEHDHRLEQLLEAARKKHVTFNKSKCEFGKDKCLYFGLMFSKDGVSPDPNKVKAIKLTDPPRNVKELNSFLCTVQYNARFMKRFAPATEKLRRLVKAPKFNWEKEHQEAFEELKKGLCEETSLVYFEPKAEHEVHVDGCPLGISATLVQRSDKDDEWRVVQYASRSLTETESRYSQIELETLAVDFACKKFHLYLYGIPFTIVTDHKPLEAIMNNPRHQTSIRLQRILVRIMDYEFKVEYRPGKYNISDYTSRHPLPRDDCTRQELSTSKEIKQYANYILQNNIPRSISKEEMKNAVKEDPVMPSLAKCIEKGQIGNIAGIQRYKSVFRELTVVDGIIMRGERIVIPDKMQKQVIQIAHEGHQGVVRTKQMLRAHVWFPGIDAAVEKHVGKCIGCQATTPSSHREPLQMTKLPDGPWENISMDFAGPLPNRDIILVMWDQYAKYPVVEFVTTTAAETTIPVMECVFATYGIPKEIKTDNGPPFNGTRFAEYAQTQGFKHRKVTPKWAEANGDVERIIQTIKKSAKIAKMEGNNIRQEIQKTVRSYRDTPHVSTGESPNKLMFGRELKGRLPSKVTKQTKPEMVRKRDTTFKQKCKEYADSRRHTKASNIQVGDKVLVEQDKVGGIRGSYPDEIRGSYPNRRKPEMVRKRDTTFKQKCKEYADSRRHTKASNIQVGDKVLVEQDKVDGLSPRYNPEPFVVVARNGSMITVLKGETKLCRNTAKCKLLKYGENEDSGDEWQPSEKRPSVADMERTTDEVQPESSRNQRPKRNRISTKDTRYKDFLT